MCWYYFVIIINNNGLFKSDTEYIKKKIVY